MTDLVKQLEDKKKALIELEKNGIKKEGYACGEDFTYWEFPIENQKTFHYVLEAEIAILEQAIAEMQKQRQEILDWIKEHEFIQNQGGYLIYADDLETYIKQLNQPKEEK